MTPGPFSYQAGSWDRKRRVVAKVEWHPGELYPRVGFIVINLGRPAERVVAFYNHRGTAEQHIKEARTPSGGRASHARSFATTRYVFSFTLWLTILATSCGPWHCRRRWRIGL